MLTHSHSRSHIYHMAKRVGFTVSKAGGSWAGKGIFKNVSSNGQTVRVMDKDSFVKATKRADKVLASSDLSQRRSGK